MLLCPGGSDIAQLKINPQRAHAKSPRVVRCNGLAGLYGGLGRLANVPFSFFARLQSRGTSKKGDFFCAIVRYKNTAFFFVIRRIPNSDDAKNRFQDKEEHAAFKRFYLVTALSSSCHFFGSCDNSFPNGTGYLQYEYNVRRQRKYKH